MKRSSLLRIAAVFAFVLATASFASAQTTKFNCSSLTTCQVFFVDDEEQWDNCTDSFGTYSFTIDDDFTTVKFSNGSRKTVYSIDQDAIEYEEDVAVTLYAYSKDGEPCVIIVTLDNPDEVFIAFYRQDDNEDVWLDLYEVDSIE